MAYIDKNGIQFTQYDGNILPRSKKIGNIDLQDYDIEDFVDGRDFSTVINAIEIDWNVSNIDDAITELNNTDGEIIEGIPVTNINTTGDLLYTIANLQAQVTVLTNLVWNAPNDLVLKTIQM